MIEYTLNSDEEKAKRRLDSALEDFIVPLIKDTIYLVPHPIKYDKQAMASLFNAIKLGLGREEWD